uniref:Tudor domain-containing protein n=1 Tax=Gongylonema pulchrum TaxID=637853 RepID=A0A183DUL6_9BILA
LLQKKNKRDNANEVEIIKEFSGGYCSSIRFEHWMVTRANKHWFYGTFLNEETAVEFFGDSSEPRKENVVMIRGWFPRICARKL